MTEIKKKDKNVVYFDLKIAADNIKKAENEVYKKNKAYFQIPGFRKGKAPKAMIENIYGKGVFFEDALNELLPDLYEEAVKELDLDVIDQPHVDIEDYELGEDVLVNIHVEVMPEVELLKYKGLEIEEVSEEVSEELIDAEIENQRQMNARQVNIDNRPVEEGDLVNIDYEGKLDGVAFEGGTAQDQDLEIGSGTFIPGFEEKVIGHEIGETFDIDVTFPEEYHAEDLKGQDVVFTVTINEISVKELPEVDDEFIKDISEFDTVEEYKADLREKKEEEARENAKTTRQARVLDALADQVQAEIPEIMIQRSIDQQEQNYEMTFQGQGFSLDAYLQMLGIDKAKFREDLREGAENQVKQELGLEAIMKAENFQVTDEDIEADAREMAKKYFPNDDEEKNEELVKQILAGDMERLRKDLERRKAIDLILEEALEVPAKKEAEGQEEEEDQE
ncbi:MAG: trigger factor [Tissierellia bacterium]|nr:trigger factor [Tissierellia bacterium]